MKEITQQLREVTDWYQEVLVAPGGDLLVTEVGEQSGLDHDDELLLEGLVHGESHLNCDVKDDVEAQGGRSSLSDDSEFIQEVKIRCMS